MTSLWSLAVACLVLAATTQAYDSALYQDMLFQDLYKRLTQVDNVYYPLDDQGYQGSQDSLYDPIVSLDSRDPGQADIRDPEFLSQSSNSDGFQYISGGAGEGKQHLTPEGTQENIQEVKSDDVLPFYCHPPNPCPKGFTEEDGCQMNVHDTAEDQKKWISEMQGKGLCTCDEEHMFDCGPSQADGDLMGGMGLGQDEQPDSKDMNELINTIFDSDNYQNPYAKGNRIAGLVAKKAPRVKRSVEVQELERLMKQKRKRNPYLQGEKIHVVAKKGSGMIY